MNGHIIGFHLQTQKVESPYKPPSNTLPVKRVKVPTLEFGHGDGTRVALVWALGLTVHTVFVRSGQSTAVYSLLRSCFRMASDRAKWSNYVHGHMAGTQGVNTTPFCAGTQTLLHAHQVWTPSYTVASLRINYCFFFSNYNSVLKNSFISKKSAFWQVNLTVKQGISQVTSRPILPFKHPTAPRYGFF